MEPTRDIQERAASGDPYAQTLLGFLLENGFGITQNKELARRWYQRAAEQSFLPAQYALYPLLVESDRDKALYWLKESAKGGYSKAQAVLASLYWEGSIVPTDPKSAFKWMNESAKQGFILAMIGLALMYEEGVCVNTDPEKAKEYLRRAAEKGDASAAQMLGERLVDAVDETNAAEGRKWIQFAAKRGDAFALLALAQMYTFGSGGVTKDEELGDLLKSLSELKFSDFFNETF